jgi:hypothetical protein
MGKSMSRTSRKLLAVSVVVASFALGGCSSSFGGGSSPPESKTVVVPACPNGTAPPCN